MKYPGTVSIAVTLAATLAVHGTSAMAQDYKGKTLNMIVASNAGGGTDRIGRLFGLYLEKYLPGNPKIVYRNFGAGGGKIRAANYFALQAKNDGYTLMQTDSSVAQPHIVRRKVSKFDPTKFEPIGGFNAGGSVVFIRKGHLQRLTGKGDPVIVGATSGSRSWQAMLVWGKEYLGWNLKWIPGLLKDGVIEIVAQEGIGFGGDYKPRAAYPNAPVFPAMLEKSKLSKLAWEGYNS